MITTLIGGRYELGERIASGGMADVFVARDTTLDRRVAIKRLKAELHTREAQERFASEAFALAGFSHPNAVAVYDFGNDAGHVNGGPFIVMELVDGPTLAQHLRDHEGTLSSGEATAIAAQVLAALGAAHAKGIVHRDVKPANVLLADGQHVKLADFGIAKAAHDADLDLTLHGQVVGTPKYLAPERVVGHDATPQSDLYSVAVMCFEMVTGAPPYLGDSTEAMLEAQRSAPVPSVRALRPDVPVAWAAVVERGLAKDPARRYASADAMREALVMGLTDDPDPTVATGGATATMPTAALAVPPSPPQRPTRVPTTKPARRGRWGWVVVPIVLALFGLGAFALTNMGGDDGGPGPLPVPATDAIVPVTNPPVTVVPTVAPTVPQISSTAPGKGVKKTPPGKAKKQKQSEQ